MKNMTPLMTVLVTVQLSTLLHAGFLDWGNPGGIGNNGTGSTPGSDANLYTVIGNGSGTNEWNVGSGRDSGTTTGPVSISNLFNGTYLTDGFDFEVTIDMSNQTMSPYESYSSGYLHDFPAVNSWMDGAAGSDSLGIRMDSGTGIIPAGNTSVSHADLMNGTATYNDLTPEIITITFDHKGAHGMSNVFFDLYEIELIADGIDPNWDHESVIVTGLGVDGNTYNASLSALNAGSSVSPTITGNTARSTGEQASHGLNDAAISVSFGNEELDTITIQYEMRRRTSVGSSSFGLGIGDVTFDSNPVPEPSSLFLCALSSLGIWYSS